MLDCMTAGARIINLSAALAQPSCREERGLKDVLDLAARRGVIVVAAAGNQRLVGGTAITRHPWVIPVVACDLHGRPAPESNLGHSIGRAGLSAPGDNITTTGPDGQATEFSGTSAATPFVTGAISLLWSEFPSATSTLLRCALMDAQNARRRSVVPPLLDAWGAYQLMARDTQ
jgi:subtilisin family serine protease